MHTHVHVLGHAYTHGQMCLYILTDMHAYPLSCMTCVALLGQAQGLGYSLFGQKAQILWTPSFPARWAGGGPGWPLPSVVGTPGWENWAQLQDPLRKTRGRASRLFWVISIFSAE